MCPSLNHHCSQGDGTCGLARLRSHGPGTGLDSYDLSLGEGWVLKESTDVDAKRRKKGCWVNTKVALSPHGKAHSRNSAACSLCFGAEGNQPQIMVLRWAWGKYQSISDCHFRKSLSIYNSSFFLARVLGQ